MERPLAPQRAEYNRSTFIRKTYLIVTAQLLVSIAIIGLCILINDLKDWVRQHPNIFLISLFANMLGWIFLKDGKGRNNDNYYWIITTSQGFMVLVLATHTEGHGIFFLGWCGIASIIIIISTIIAFQTEYIDPRENPGIIYLGLGLLLLLLILLFLDPIVHKGLHMTALVLLAVYMAFIYIQHTQIFFNVQNDFSPETCIFAGYSLYDDIFTLTLVTLAIGAMTLIISF